MRAIVATLLLSLSALAACGGDPCNPANVEDGCDAGQTCVYTEERRYTCETLCQSDTGCEADGGVCEGQGASCPACDDVVSYCL